MFLLHSTDDGRIPSLEYLPAGSFSRKAGTPLTMTGGKLAIATGTTKPLYILAAERASAVSGEIVPVFRVDPDMIFETTFSVSASAVSIGQKVTIANGGTSVTATTADGVAEVVYMSGTAAGDMCRVRFA